MVGFYFIFFIMMEVRPGGTKALEYGSRYIVGNISAFEGDENAIASGILHISHVPRHHRYLK